MAKQFKIRKQRIVSMHHVPNKHELDRIFLHGKYPKRHIWLRASKNKTYYYVEIVQIANEGTTMKRYTIEQVLYYGTDLAVAETKLATLLLKYDYERMAIKYAYV